MVALMRVFGPPYKKVHKIDMVQCASISKYLRIDYLDDPGTRCPGCV